MSFSINSNGPALSALQYLTQNQTDYSNTVARLSSGLKLNQASDDPAAYQASQTFQTAISALDTANRNTQDAINLAKTADGAMGQISTLLQQLKSVVTNAANNATASSSDLQASQTEVQGILTSINRIATQTSWGSRTLLDGTSGTSVSVTSNNASALSLGSTFGGQLIRGGAVSMTQVSAATQSTTTLGTSFAGLNSPVKAGTFSINGNTVSVAAGDTVNAVLGKINSISSSTNVVASFTAGQGITLTSNRFGSKYGVQYVEPTPILNGGASVNAPTAKDAVYDVTIPTGTSPATSTERFTGGQGPSDDGITLTSPSGAKLLVTAAGNSTPGTVTIGSVQVGNMNFQIGPNASDAANFGLPSMTANNLGTTAVPGLDLSKIDVTSVAGAQAALKVVDNAVDQVASDRASLGAFQANVLESNSRVIQVASQNFTASNSTIRDTDIASDMTALTRQQIIQQSNISVLAQANKLPESILELLK